MSNVLLALEDADFVRTTLLATHVYLYAQDQAESQRKMMPTTRESSLTKEVAECLEMVEARYGESLVAARDLEQAALETPLNEYYDDEAEDDD